MFHKCLKDANNTKAPWLMSLGRIFITDCSNQDKQCSVLFFFLIYAFRFPPTEDHFIFSLILCKNQLLVKPLYTFPLSKENTMVRV